MWPWGVALVEYDSIMINLPYSTSITGGKSTYLLLILIVDLIAWFRDEETLQD